MLEPLAPQVAVCWTKDARGQRFWSDGRSSSKRCDIVRSQVSSVGSLNGMLTTLRELEDRLLLVEERRNGHERFTSWGTVLAALVAVAALVVSLLPLGQKEADRATSRTAFVEALTSADVNSALKALPYAEASSTAATFANVVARWRGAQLDADGVSDVEDGTWMDLGEGRYELCLPALPVPLFPEECITLSNIDYSPEGKILAFAIDGIPTSSLVRESATSDSLTADGTGPANIFSIVGVTSPDGASKTLIYGVTRRREEDRQYPVTFDSILIQDENEEKLETYDLFATPSLGYWAKGDIAIRVPSATEFLNICWKDLKDDRSPCDWLIGTGMK